MHRDRIPAIGLVSDVGVFEVAVFDDAVRGAFTERLRGRRHSDRVSLNILEPDVRRR